MGILHWQQPRGNQADTRSSIVAQALPYDCDAGRWNAFNGWSAEKQTWCCTNQQKGCTGDPLVTGVRPGGAVPVQGGYNPANYDCDAGRWNAFNGWAEAKKAWCCANQQKGCADDPLVTGVRPGGVPAGGAVANPNNYDCDAGRWNAHNGWSVDKQTWCCANQQKGCANDPLVTGVAPGGGGGGAAGGANPNNYDCDAGRWNAHNGWSVGKQTWCCANQHKGCAGDQVVTGGGAAVANPGVAPVANPNNYDCDAGRWNANNGWSVDKKSWCCTYQQKGCPGDQVDTGR